VAVGVLLDNFHADEELECAAARLDMGYLPDIGRFSFRDWLIEVVAIFRTED
jgi:hypothetical protein